MNPTYLLELFFDTSLMVLGITRHHYEEFFRFDPNKHQGAKAKADEQFDRASSEGMIAGNHYWTNSRLPTLSNCCFLLINTKARRDRVIAIDIRMIHFQLDKVVRKRHCKSTGLI